MMLPVLVSHLRFHKSLEVLERRLKYKFNDRMLLQVSVHCETEACPRKMHPSVSWLHQHDSFVFAAGHDPSILPSQLWHQL